MRKLFLSLAALALSFAAFAQKITFTPQWTPQAQFAGYYMAQEKGFYSEEGLDVTIKHIPANFTGTATDFLFTGESQIVGQQLLQAMVARSDGKKLVNVFQLTQKTGLMLLSKEPVDKFVQLDGKKVGRWKAGFSEICEIIQNSAGIDVEWVPFISGINLFVFGAVDATLCYSYSEYIKVLMSVGKFPEENIVRFSDMIDFEIPEDGLYVTEKYYKKNKATVDKFVRASKKGWEYVRRNPEETMSVVMKYVKEGNIVTNETVQKMMLEEYLRLQVNPATGEPDYAAVTREQFDQIQQQLLMSALIVNPITYEEIIK